MAHKGAIRLAFEAQRSLAFGSIGASYTGIGTVFTNPIRILFVQNLTDATLQFSVDGITDHFPLPGSGFLLIDVTTNKTQDSGLYIPEGDRVYVKTIGSPTTGTVYVTSAYGEDE